MLSVWTFGAYNQIPVSSSVVVLSRWKCYWFGLLGHIVKFQFLVQFLFFLGGNVICLDFWGRKSGPYIQALHFCLSLGLLTGPLLVDPLSQTHVPNVLQKALPFALSHPGKIVVEE